MESSPVQRWETERKEMKYASLESLKELYDLVLAIAVQINRDARFDLGDGLQVGILPGGDLCIEKRGSRKTFEEFSGCFSGSPYHEVDGYDFHDVWMSRLDGSSCRGYSSWRRWTDGDVFGAVASYRSFFGGCSKRNPGRGREEFKHPPDAEFVQKIICQLRQYQETQRDSNVLGNTVRKIGSAIERVLDIVTP